MISRREVVTAGVLGTLAGSVPLSGEAAQNKDDQAVVGQLREIESELTQIRGVLDGGLRGPGLNDGSIGSVRERFTTHLRSTGKFPDFMEIGTSVFYDVYDWHVRHQQQIQIVRIADQRFAIQFMFTQLVVRWEQAPNFLGIPYDRA